MNAEDWDLGDLAVTISYIILGLVVLVAGGLGYLLGWWVRGR